MKKEKSVSQKIVKSVSAQFAQLMFFLLLLFLFRPGEKGLIYTIGWQLIFACVLFTAIFNCHHKKPVKIFAICTGIPALLCNWGSLIYQTPILVLAGHFFALVFLLVCTSSILYLVIVRARVTIETLRGAICVYFMVGYIFTLVYVLLELLYPGSFQIAHLHSSAFLHSAYLADMVYFSFITLLAIGYGDITPLTPLGQNFVILEGIIGQFYLAILVARLVAVYSLREGKHLLAKELQFLHKDGK
jgi:hypothetical protein